MAELTNEVTEMILPERPSAPISKAMATVPQFRTNTISGQQLITVGVQDDLIQAMKAIESAGGGIIKLAKGTHIVSEEIFTPENTILEGAGRGGTILELSSNNSLQCNNSDITLTNFTIKGSSAVNVYCDGSTNLLIDRLEVKDGTQSAILLLRNNVQTIIRNCLIKDNLSNAINLNLSTVEDTIISNNIFDNNGAGPISDSGTRTLIANNRGATNETDALQLIDISPVFFTANTNWNSVTVSTDSIYNGGLFSNSSQNALVDYKILWPAGTWTVEILFKKAASHGIASVQLDSVEQGTIDMYNASDSVNFTDTVTGIDVAQTGSHTLRFKMATKNGSSSNYRGNLQHIQLRKTA